jgi:hypothetical protein
LSTALAVGLAACGDDGGGDAPPPPPTDMGTVDTSMPDLGPRVDLGGPDMTMTAPDPCAAETPEEALATYACNGAPMPPPEANALFGACTPGTETMPEGSCTDADLCVAFEDSPSTPFCVNVCSMRADLYAATSTCPRGSRCINFGGEEGAEGLCMPSCSRDADCASGHCDLSDGSCYFADPAPPDAGMPDAGMPDGGIPDAAPPDGGPSDADTPDDGSVAHDGSTPDGSAVADGGALDGAAGPAE